eukprot:18115-Heterococcus_DN1.PRE.8
MVDMDELDKHTQDVPNLSVNVKDGKLAFEQRVQLEQRSHDLFSDIYPELATDMLDNRVFLTHWLDVFNLGPYESNTKARAALAEVHISIYDLLDNKLDRVHPSKQSLRRYNKKYGKTFPRQMAKEDGLSVFLRKYSSNRQTNTEERACA